MPRRVDATLRERRIVTSDLHQLLRSAAYDETVLPDDMKMDL